MIGQTLSHFRITAKLGEGGMGEVYQAEDGKLGRDVAIKILPPEFISDPERLARFEREAKVLAALNHPNIAGIYEIGEEGGVHFLAMELAEGEDLSIRIDRGPIPLDEALPYALKIASALEAAHDRGVVHRDLKPANVRVAADGSVKVLDFGLAKIWDAAADRTSDLSISPTLTAGMTQAGVLLGTAAYMSPEQARGGAVDKQTDIWAFGCLLYEMLSGVRSFDGETVTDLIAAVVKDEPDWSRLPDDLPASLTHTLRRCLAKQPQERFRDIGDVSWELSHPRPEGALPAGAEGTIAMSSARSSRLGLAIGIPAALLIGFLTAKAIDLLEVPPSTGLAHFEMLLPDDAPLAVGAFLPTLAWTPDGRSIVYVGNDDGVHRLYVRGVDDPRPQRLDGTEGAEGPFVSPDGQWVGFFADDQIRKIPLAGGAAQSILPTLDFRGATWGAGDVIVFTDGQNQVLKRVQADGSGLARLTTFEGTDWSHRFPRFLPDGKSLLYCAQTEQDFQFDRGELRLLSLSSGSSTSLAVSSCDTHYDPSAGRLIYVQGGSLNAQPFDLDRLEILGPPTELVEDVAIQTNTAAAQVAVSRAGDIVYASGPPLGQRVEMTWFDRGGNAQSRFTLEGVFRGPRLSPDASSVLLQGIGANVSGLWSFDLATGAGRIVTSSGMRAAWSPDGTRLASSHNQGRAFTEDQDVYLQKADFSETPDPLFTGEGAVVTDVAADGTIALTMENDLWTLPPNEIEAVPFLRSPAVESGLRFSPDGHFVTYVSDESGVFEIYVTEFPESGRRWQLSTGGASQPVWTRASNEIFYRAGRLLISVLVETAPTFEAGVENPLFLGPYEGVLGQQGEPNYDVTADGQRILMLPSPDLQSTRSSLGLLVGWRSEE